MTDDLGAKQAKREAVRLGITIIVALVIILLARQWWRYEIREVAKEVFVEMKELEQ